MNVEKMSTAILLRVSMFAASVIGVCSMSSIASMSDGTNSHEVIRESVGGAVARRATIEGDREVRSWVFTRAATFLSGALHSVRYAFTAW